jgi:hypothetical protein
MIVLMTTLKKSSWGYFARCNKTTIPLGADEEEQSLMEVVKKGIINCLMIISLKIQYTQAQFRRRFRMQRHVFLRIVEALGIQDEYFRIFRKGWCSWKKGPFTIAKVHCCYSYFGICFTDWQCRWVCLNWWKHCSGVLREICNRYKCSIWGWVFEKA